MEVISVPVWVEISFIVQNKKKIVCFSNDSPAMEVAQRNSEITERSYFLFDKTPFPDAAKHHKYKSQINVFYLWFRHPSAAEPETLIQTSFNRSVGSREELYWAME